LQNVFITFLKLLAKILFAFLKMLDDEAELIIRLQIDGFKKNVSKEKIYISE
jgi:hypothetical protein